MGEGRCGVGESGRKLQEGTGQRQNLWDYKHVGHIYLSEKVLKADDFFAPLPPPHPSDFAA